MLTTISLLIISKGSKKLRNFAKLLMSVGLVFIILGIAFTSPLNSTKIIDRIILTTLLCIFIYFINYVFGRKVFLANDDLLNSSGEMIRYIRILFPNYNPNITRLRIQSIIEFSVGILISLLILTSIYKKELFLNDRTPLAIIIFIIGIISTIFTKEIVKFIGEPKGKGGGFIPKEERIINIRIVGVAFIIIGLIELIRNL
jgi:hypothetical protein